MYSTERRESYPHNTDDGEVNEYGGGQYPYENEYGDDMEERVQSVRFEEPAFDPPVSIRPSSQISIQREEDFESGRTSGIDKETNQKITTALQSMMKKLGKQMIRDRIRRKIDSNGVLDMESINIAIEFFRREEIDWEERKVNWLTLDTVQQIYDLVVKTRILQSNGQVNIEKLKSVFGSRIRMDPQLFQMLLEKSKSKSDNSTIEYNKFLMLCITLTADSMFTVLENALSLFCVSGSVTIHHQNEEDIVAIEDFVYCVKFVADEETRCDNNEIAQELKLMAEELQDMMRDEPLITRGMIVSSISWQTLLENESRKAGGTENI